MKYLCIHFYVALVGMEARAIYNKNVSKVYLGNVL